MTFPSSFSAAHHCDCHSKGFSSSYSFQSQQSSSLKYSSNENGQSFSYSQSSSVSYRVEISSHNTRNQSDNELVYSKEKSFSSSSIASPSVDTETAQQADKSDKVKAVETSPMTEGAKNILSFIEDRLAKEKAAGASEEELSELLEQGIAGFKQGYGEAIEILAADGDMIPAVTDSVSKLYDEVNSGFAALKETYTNNAPIDKADAVNSAVAAPASSVSYQSSNESSRIMRLSSGSLGEQAEVIAQQKPLKSFVEQLPEVKPVTPTKGEEESLPEKLPATASVTPGDFIPAGGFVETEVEYGRLDKFSFSLETTDGDLVTINALNTSVFAAKYEAGDDKGDIYEDMIAGINNKQSYDFDVQGELDEDEMAAIEHLMGQVMDLADEFYNGDLEQAYTQAANIGFDANEITGYSLDMKQLEQYKVATTTYQEVAPETTVNQPLDVIGDYADKVLAALENPGNNTHFDFAQMLDLLSKQVDEQVTSDSPVSFNDSVKGVIAAQEEGKYAQAS